MPRMLYRTTRLKAGLCAAALRIEGAFAGGQAGGRSQHAARRPCVHPAPLRPRPLCPPEQLT